MKNLKLNKGVAVVMVMLLSGGVVFGQAGNMLSTAETEISNASGTLQNIFGLIFYALAGGAVLYAAWAYFFDNGNMKKATTGLIAGLLLGTIGAAIGLIS